MPAPLLLSTWSFGVTANRAGWPALIAGGPDAALDAVERACAAVEDDAAVDSVGVGGLPDASGRVSLDGCVMLSPRRSAGVACVRRHANVVSIARQVMDRTPHKLLVGDDADAFADECGFPARDLLTDAARQLWERWSQARGSAAGAAQLQHVRRANREEMDGDATDPNASHDTVGVLALDARGVLAGGCSTSGMAFKLPGRVGDSPILGHGLYVDPRAGAATATGRGELMMGTCASFLAVECLRAGASPSDAVRDVLARLADSYDLTPDDQCGLIVLAPDGTWASGALVPGFRVAVTDAAGTRLTDAQFVLKS